MTFALVVITGMSISSVVSSVMVMSVRNREKAARDAKEDARDAKKRARQEKAEAKEKASKEANEAARAEVVEAKRIEKESSEWATMLNNFMVARLFKGDLTKYVNNGNVEVPGELAPHVLKKLKKRPSSKLRHCKETKDINQDIRFLTYNPAHSHFNVLVENEIPINGKNWDFFFTHKEEGKEGEALEITKCYDNKSKWLPDYFDSNNCQRNKHLEYMRNCGGPDLFTCPCSSDPGKNPKPDDNNVHFYKECNFRGNDIMIKPGSGDWHSALSGPVVQGIKSIIIPGGIVVKFYEEGEDGKVRKLFKEVKGPWYQACSNKFVKVNSIWAENLK